jgi:hypothetical protein
MILCAAWGVQGVFQAVLVGGFVLALIALSLAASEALSKVFRRPSR